MGVVIVGVQSIGAFIFQNSGFGNAFKDFVQKQLAILLQDVPLEKGSKCYSILPMHRLVNYKLDSIWTFYQADELFEVDQLIGLLNPPI